MAWPGPNARHQTDKGDVVTWSLWQLHIDVFSSLAFYSSSGQYSPNLHCVSLQIQTGATRCTVAIDVTFSFAYFPLPTALWLGGACLHLCVCSASVSQGSLLAPTQWVYNEVLMSCEVRCNGEHDKQTKTNSNITDGCSVWDWCLNVHNQLFTSPAVQMAEHI